MGKRRISQNEVERIGRERVNKLTDLAISEVHAGSDERARRYVEIARRICGKCRIPMPPEKPYCRNCQIPLLPGVSCSTRIGNHMVRTTCNRCGEIVRRPYLREQSHE